uniref:Uncharacterized protein n=1 Tax=Eptatretus burgeri TaxID=7764 RepID=A0A8C4Q022_EPTBU
MECAECETSLSEMPIQRIDGDIINGPPTETLAYCISRDCPVGVGMLTLFEEKFSGIQELFSHTRKIRDCVVLKKGTRFVYYLISKESADLRSMCTSLKESLKVMKNYSIGGNSVEDSEGGLQETDTNIFCLLVVKFFRGYVRGMKEGIVVWMK